MPAESEKPIELLFVITVLQFCIGVLWRDHRAQAAMIRYVVDDLEGKT